MKYLQLFLQVVILLAALFILQTVNDQRQQMTIQQTNLQTIQSAEELHSVIERHRAFHGGQIPSAEDIWVQAGWEGHWDRQLSNLNLANTATGSYQEPKAFSLKFGAWIPNFPGAGSVSYRPLPDGGYVIEAYGTNPTTTIFRRAYQ